MQSSRLAYLLIVVLLSISSTAGYGAIYKCESVEGIVLQDRPCQTGEQEQLVSTLMEEVYECTRSGWTSWGDNFNGCGDKKLLREACTDERYSQPYSRPEAKTACNEFFAFENNRLERMSPMQKLKETDPDLWRAKKEQECIQASQLAVGDLNKFLEWERSHPGYCEF